MKEYIDRGALYSEIVPHYKSANAFGSSRNVCKTWGKVLDMVQNAPAADVVERKRGEWIEHEWAEEENGFLISNFECSACHEWERKTSDFCPNCGADMREVDHAD